MTIAGDKDRAARAEALAKRDAEGDIVLPNESGQVDPRLTDAAKLAKASVKGAKVPLPKTRISE